jgi:hypothetical protein
MNSAEKYRPTISKLPLPDQIAYLLQLLEKRDTTIDSLEDRVKKLENPRQETPAEKIERRIEEAEQARRERDRRHAESAAAELARARAQAIRAIAKLLPEAIRQAKAKPPRPALLRLILRATR